MSVNTKLKKSELRSYLNKDFNSFRADLLLYAKTFFPDSIQDFSEASLGGLLLELNAYVGDVMSYYLDHQFNELNIETAVEDKNIQKLLRAAGVPIAGAAPASAEVDFFITISSDSSDSSVPIHNNLPIINEGTTVSSRGVTFTLISDLDFSEKDEEGNYLFHQITPSNAGDPPSFYTLKRTGVCVSGTTSTKPFPIPNTFVPFRKISLPGTDVTEIIAVIDSEGNEYHEVSSLVQNVVYKRVVNLATDAIEVPENLELIPAPYRYVVENDALTGVTTLRFGSGRADTLDDDIIPDPSELSLPLYGKKTISRFSIDPNNLLRTQTLGISPIGTTITVKYRYGGGLSHNVGPGSINGISSLLTTFNNSVSRSLVSKIRASINIRNPQRAAGGENPPSLQDLKRLVVSAKNSQSRIVTKDDLLSHVYMMPSRFGRIFRAGVRSNPDNPLATMLYIVSRNRSGKLVTAPDSLKDNLALFLNENRLISDAIDIVDSQIVNFGIKYSIVVNGVANKNAVIQSINAKIKNYFKIVNFQIDQPIFLTEIQKIIIKTSGVISLSEIEMINLSGITSGKIYSNVILNIEDATFKGIVFPPAGGIFEMRYPSSDIVGMAE